MFGHQVRAIGLIILIIVSRCKETIDLTCIVSFDYMPQNTIHYSVEIRLGLRWPLVEQQKTQKAW